MDDLKLIKKHYGDNMMHLCRDLFPTILETEGLLWKLISSEFAYNKSLYDDLVSNNLEEKFKNFIFDKIHVEKKEIISNVKIPRELLDEAGYILYECHTEEDIQSFRKYYYKTKEEAERQYINNNGIPSYVGEELCTFNGDRLDRCHVFFAVKKNVDDIKREDFDKPNRQDEYGTSVISIQIGKDSYNTLSIKNRYNHTVNNPDATFSNNLDNIIPGLTESFNKYYDFEINNENTTDFEIPNYVRVNWDNKLHKYNYEINNTYYGPNNFLHRAGHHINPYLDKSKYIVLDYFVIDLEEKKFLIFDENIRDTFHETIPEIRNIRVEVEKVTKNRRIIINDGNIEIVINRDSQIIEYKNNEVEEIDRSLLFSNTTLKSISLPNVKTIVNDFLMKNNSLESLYMPKLEEVGIYFLPNNETLKEIILPNIKIVGSYFLNNNEIIEKVDLPKLEKVYDNFMTSNHNLTEIDFPNLRFIGRFFLPEAYNIEKVNLPLVEEVKTEFLEQNKKIKSLYLPNLKKIGDSFLKFNSNIEELYIPECMWIGRNFLHFAEKLKILEAPKVKEVKYCFLACNQDLEELNFPDLDYIERGFMSDNKNIKEVNIPRLDEAYYHILSEYLRELIGNKNKTK